MSARESLFHPTEGILLTVTENLRIFSGFTLLTFFYIIRHMFTLYLSFSSPFLRPPRHCITFSPYFIGHFFSTSCCFSFIVTVPSYINIGIPLVSSSATGCCFAVFSTSGLSNSPTTYTILPEQVSLRSMYQTRTIVHGADTYFNCWAFSLGISLASRFVLTCQILLLPCSWSPGLQLTPPEILPSLHAHIPLFLKPLGFQSSSTSPLIFPCLFPLPLLLLIPGLTWCRNSTAPGCNCCLFPPPPSIAVSHLSNSQFYHPFPMTKKLQCFPIAHRELVLKFKR